MTGLALWYVLDATDAYARPVIGWLAFLSKWSMLDVFIIALIVLVADGRCCQCGHPDWSDRIFGRAVLTSTWATRRLSALTGN